MKLMMIQGGFGAGGAEKIMAQLAAHRHAQGDEVNVAAMFLPEAGPFFPYPPGVSLTVLAPDAPRDKLLHVRRLRAIRRHILDTRPDVILSFLTKVNCLTLLAARGTGIPVVISERNNARRQSWSWAHLQNVLARRAVGLVMQTEGSRDVLPRDLREKAVIVPNLCLGVPFNRLPPEPSLCRFVAVGRLDPQKGFDMLIRAFAALPPQPATQLTIFGQGPEYSVLDQQIRSAGLQERISLAGLAPTPMHWLEAGDLLVVSSRFEGFSNVVAEATCSGMPIVSFDCPYGPGEMIQDGLNGLLVRSEDEAELAAVMAKVAADPGLRERLSRNAHLAARKLHPDRVLTLWDAVLDHALSSAMGEDRRRLARVGIQGSAASSSAPK